ncbi:carboxymuconolactone decarboxylase family protein [Streptomyces sp. NPDC005492]|uniref:carboxymuconolactone decarboxylase family protein n=1 Tax=Streptomyces sp. NPDC005492 TaxID=3156883 RepID=UPI0033AF1EDB
MRPRIVQPTPDEMSPDQHELYKKLLSSPRSSGPRPFPLVDDDGRLRGPFGAMLLEPELGNALQDLGGAVRYRTPLSPRAREIAILIVAAHTDCAYEWQVHEHAARLAGLTDEELSAIPERRGEAFADRAERTLFDTTWELVATRDLTDDAYARAVASLGAEQLFTLTTLVGYYQLLALQLGVFRVGA